MQLNMIATGIELIGTTVKKLNIENEIIDIEKSGKRNFGLNINEPEFEKSNNKMYAQMVIDFEIEIDQYEERDCKIKMSLEGAFLAGEDVTEEVFRDLVAVNGAAALIGIARGKIETISATIFNNGKIVIPFVNVIDYYKSL